MLRAIHGDIYSQERLFRFGLSDTPNCETCGEIETINHKILECEYAATRWEALASIIHVTANPAEINFAMGAHESCSLATLTIHAELIARLIRKHRPTHVAPLEYVKNMIETLIKNFLFYLF